MTVSEVKGYAARRATKRSIGEPNTWSISFPKSKSRIVVASAQADQVVAKIREAAYTGKIGDGKIFCNPGRQAVRVRTR